ncbi:MAG: hypothetical protein WD397_08005 [Wenzhouxiangellaceae bacterium]
MNDPEHLLAHEGGYGVRMTANGLKFADTSGRAIPQVAVTPDYSPPNLLRRPQAPRLRRFARSRILTPPLSTIGVSTFPVRSVAKTPYSRDLEPPRDDRAVNNPG